MSWYQSNRLGEVCPNQLSTASGWGNRMCRGNNKEVRQSSPFIAPGVIRRPLPKTNMIDLCGLQFRLCVSRPVSFPYVTRFVHVIALRMAHRNAAARFVVRRRQDLVCLCASPSTWQDDDPSMTLNAGNRFEKVILALAKSFIEPGPRCDPRIVQETRRSRAYGLALHRGTQRGQVA